MIKDWQARPVCVLGGGVLGRRIGACLVAGGYEVRIRDPSPDARESAVRYVEEHITEFTTLSHRQSGNVTAVEDLETAVKDCWLVFEAVPEILALKESTFADLEKYAPEDCILATNSSSYKSSELVSKIGDGARSRVLNTHFMMPPQVMIVELMTCGHTSEALFPFLSERLRECGLHPITALKESTGFIFNRIWAAIKREVLSVLAEGVSTPETIDAMWIELYGSRKVGPCTIMDSVGLDTVEHIEEHYIKERKLPTYHLDWLKSNYLLAGKLGAKSDRGGFYPCPAPGTQTKILVLNVGLAEPLAGKSQADVLHSGQILAFTAEDRGSRATQLVGKLAAPDGIDVAKSTMRMYWTNMGNPKENNGSIQSANLDGTDVRYVLSPGVVHTPKQLVIDQDENKIYCCDREGLRVIRCNLDGSDLEIIYQSGDWKAEPHKREDETFWPVGITISKKLGKFFWTQKGRSKANEGRIFCANLESHAHPAQRNDIEQVISGLPECIDLEFDDDTGSLYWTDRGELPLGNTLNRKQMAGAASPAEQPFGREILAQGLGEGIGLRLDRQNRCLYVADLGGHVWKCSTQGGPKEKLYEGETHSYTGITFFKV